MIDPAALTALDRYRLLTGTIIPRPVAWITTVSDEGLVNLAPFSFFQGVTATPATVMVCIAHREPEKDTLANLRASGEAVIHLVPPPLLDAMHASSAEYPRTVSEAEALGLGVVPSEKVRPPRLVGAEVAFECRVASITPVGTPPTSLVLLEVLGVHLDPAITAADGQPDPARLRTVARLGGDNYLDPASWGLLHRARQRRPRS